jgi:hypothetical protein
VITPGFVFVFQLEDLDDVIDLFKNILWTGLFLGRFTSYSPFDL